MADKLNSLEKCLGQYEVTIRNQKECLSEVKALAEETSQIVAEGLTEFRQIVDTHSKTLDQLDTIIRSGNGNPPLLVRTALLENKIMGMKEEAISVKAEVSKQRGEASDLLAKAIEDKKDRRGAWVAIIVAVVSLLGTIATAVLAYFKP